MEERSGWTSVREDECPGGRSGPCGGVSGSDGLARRRGVRVGGLARVEGEGSIRGGPSPPFQLTGYQPGLGKPFLLVRGAGVESSSAGLGSSAETSQWSSFWCEPGPR